ncbi:MAG: hypothetical protein JNL42_11180 [Anaerolineae bacterium]|nr:hypothetical protein [Anaerolineae bacterium]
MSQTVSSVVTRYLLDVQPGLAQVIAATTGSDTTRFVHDFRGIHTQQTPGGAWLHPRCDSGIMPLGGTPQGITGSRAAAPRSAAP